MAWTKDRVVLRDADGDGLIDVFHVEFVNSGSGERAIIEHVLSYGVDANGGVISDQRRERSDWTEVDIDALSAQIAESHGLGE